MGKNHCIACGDEVIGRNDKKFCDNACRSNYHNEINSTFRKQFYRTNSILKKNHQILAHYLRLGKTKIRKQELQEHGFRFDYHTHVMKLAERREYYFCYNQGWQETEEDWLHLIAGT